MTLYDKKQVRLTTDLLYCPPPSGAVHAVAGPSYR